MGKTRAVSEIFTHKEIVSTEHYSAEKAVLNLLRF